VEFLLILCEDVELVATEEDHRRVVQRTVRAKRTLARERVPFAEPEGDDLARRLPVVLDVVYLIFNEGYLAGTGDELTRPPLAVEAHRLARC
jgi:predicted RNA polymerase sigma factor